MSATTWLGWLGTTLVLGAYAQPDARRLRIVSLVASLVLIVFNATLGIWSNVALEVALVGINVVQLWRQAAVSSDRRTGRPEAQLLQPEAKPSDA